ncbi:MAG: DNA-directed RNA polymerase subunit omega [Oscillospiraceae bacterium]
MMLYPPMADLVEKTGSRYLLVNLVARRAREISTMAQENEITLDKKPVSCAIDEVYTGRLKVADETLVIEDPNEFSSVHYTK